MEQSAVIDTLETTLLANIWAERPLIFTDLFAICLGLYVHLGFIKIVELLLGTLLFTGIVFFGFVAFVAHGKYYFQFEKGRKVKLYSDRLVISVHDQVREQIFKKDILRITLYDKIRSEGGNLRGTFLDPFYYLTITAKNRQQVTLTSILDIKLKAKITDWYGQELKHIYQFFPFPGSPYR